MEKTIKIDNKPVTFKCTGGTLYRYKQQFGRELLADAASLVDVDTTKKKKVKSPDGKISYVDDFDLTKLNLELVYNLAWTMAKTADPSIPDPMAWLDSFDAFPIVKVVEPLMEMLQKSIEMSEKNG